MLDTLAAADHQVAQVLDRISASRSPVSRATVSALERLLATLRPAAAVRARLADLDHRVLAAGIRLRRQRHDRLRATRLGPAGPGQDGLGRVGTAVSGEPR